MANSDIPAVETIGLTKRFGASTAVDALDLRDITFVMQDWGGPIGCGYTVRHPERVHSLVLMNTVSGYGTAVTVAIAVVGSELLILAWLRHKFFQTSFTRSFLAITVGGAIIAALSAGLGIAAAG